jgi:glycosyltransferase involved in cell wall biosynthesis
MRYLMKIVSTVFLGLCDVVFCSLKENRFDCDEKPFVILICSYNNEKYARDNIISAINQKYSNYRIIFVNDCSSDRTLEIVEDTVQQFDAASKVKIINNKERKLGLRNYYEAIVHHTSDEEIVVNLDGDDFLASKKVLLLLNKVYHNLQKEVWMTYGQFVTLQGRVQGWNVQIPSDIVKKNDYRSFGHMPTHLRTFYSWLFKRINKADLMYSGHFFEMTWDYAFMLPMLEMSNGRFMLIDKALYIYNDSNPINDHKVNQALQNYYARHIRGMMKYKPLKHNVFAKCKEEDCVLCNESIKDQIYEFSD